MAGGYISLTTPQEARIERETDPVSALSSGRGLLVEMGEARQPVDVPSHKALKADPLQCAFPMWLRTFAFPHFQSAL